ncbi:uncharacterized protein PG986_011666 [Apiospora aurea]|uniref:3'-5' exonuclease domain-containing protein n=1 Tax=Apiospora aurea TaxID=335848 RepID=A0ABR1PXS2_9PEZI
MATSFDIASRSHLIALPKKRTIFNLKGGFKAVAASATEAVAPAAAAAAAVPIAAPQSLEKLGRDKKPELPAVNAPPPGFMPVGLPGTAKKIQTFFIDTPAGVSELADRLWTQALAGRANDDNHLYVDLEGADLCRDGSLSLLIFYSSRLREAFVVDVFLLQAAAFTTRGSKHDVSVQDILESADCRKAFFDVRNDSDALFWHYGVGLRGCEDIQLMENASRDDGNRNLVSGLMKCMTKILTVAEKEEWDNAKAAGKDLFNQGSFEVLDVRPLSPEIISYCVGDVYYLPRLRKAHWKKLSEEWREKVMEETKARIIESQQELYQPLKAAMARGPWEAEWVWVPLEEYKPRASRPAPRPTWVKQKRLGVQLKGKH